MAATADQSPSAGYQHARTGVQVATALNLAESAVQPGDLGTAAAEDVGTFATAAQGGLADTALQPNAPATGWRGPLPQYPGGWHTAFGGRCHLLG